MKTRHTGNHHALFVHWLKSVGKGISNLLLILIPLVAGCAHQGTSGLGSATDFGYSVDTPEKREAVLHRFDAAVKLLASNGLEARTVQSQPEVREVAFVGQGMEATLILAMPDTDLANIRVNYHFVAKNAANKAKGNDLLAQLQKILTP